MDNYVYIGKIVNTFGIKGELKIISNFEMKDRVFKKGISLLIGPEKRQEVIENHRVHKNFDLILLRNYNNINDVLKYKCKSIYVLRSDLNLQDNEYLLEDLIGFKVYENDLLLGIVIDYEENSYSTLLKVKGEKDFYLPLIDEYIKSIDLKDMKILTNKGSELIL